MDSNPLPEPLFLALARAEDQVSRLDEQLLHSELRKGWQARMDLRDAAAWAWNRGESVALEDLVLHDHGMDARMPDLATRAAHLALRGRRKAAQGGGELMSWLGAAWIAGRAPHPPPRSARTSGRVGLPASVPPAEGMWDALSARLSGLEAGQTDGPRAGVEEWVTVLEGAPESTPALLAAASAMEGWRLVQPFPREDFVGGLLVGALLRSRGRFAAGLFPMEIGVRAVGRMRDAVASGPLEGRLSYWLNAMTAAALAGADEMRQLTLGRRILLGRVAVRRSSSKAPALAELVLSTPVITAPLVAAELGISAQAARKLIESFGGSLHEITGQPRYRAWSLHAWGV